MSAPSNLNTSLRKTISALFVLALFGVFLSLYFFKYIPQRQSDFHSRAFGELHQINEAFEDRDSAYRQAIRSFLEGAPRNCKDARDAFNSSALRSMFTFNYYRERIRHDSLFYGENPYRVAPPTIVPASLEGHLLNYPVYTVAKIQGEQAGDTVLELSKSLDSVLNSVIPVQKDIFDDYLLIQDNHTDSSRDHLHEGRIVYNSGELAIDRYVNTDTLLKKSSGFSLMNVYDIKIEGNDYKLFLCPFSNYSQNLIMAGLISRPHYTQAYASIPANMLTAAGIWLLIILCSLPFLKIYIIGAKERVTRWDLRMIIGSYFIAAFVLIILFSRNFLDHVQSTRNRSDLNKLTSQIQENLSAEISDICSQLRRYDNIVYGPNVTYLNKVKILKFLQDSSLAILGKKPGLEDTLNDALTPEFYPNLDNIFWIDSSGQWVARWGFKRDFSRMPLIHVEDRQYFKDARNDDWDTLKGPSGKDSFCIQPTLGKQNGVYTITVVIKSLTAQWKGSHIRKNKKDTASLPIMLGLSTKMYSLCNPVLPPSYHFSIINDEGQVQFDSESGRGLQSNIYSETPYTTELRRFTLYDHEQFFTDFTLRGKKVAMLARRLPGLPYTILTYHDLSEDKTFQFHTIGLCILFMAGILALLFLSALCNEWSKAKTGFLKIPPINFEWLRPVLEKYGYYLHLRWGMLGFFGIYLLIWFSIEYFFKPAEFSLLLISLLLPFYIALHYYLLREKQKVHAKQSSERTLPAAFFCVAFALTGINVYILCSHLDSLTIWLILFAQISFVSVLLFSDAKFKGKKPSSSFSELIPHYTWTILTGVFMISIVPATGMFCLFYKEETKAVLRQQEMYIGRVAKERENGIHKRSKDYSFNPGKLPHTDSLFELAFQKGVYTLDKLSIDTPDLSTTDNYFIPPYNRLRHLVFSNDSTVFWGVKAKEQADESQTAYKTAVDSGNPELKQAALSLPSPDLQNALDLAMQDILSLDNRYTILLCLAMILVFLLASWLTQSLAKRIFLIDILDKYYQNNAESKDKVRQIDTGWIDHLSIRLLNSSGVSAPKKTRGEIVLDRSYGEKLRIYESGKKDNTLKEENILIVQTKMKEVYENLWAKLLPDERLLLYNFATDGLINYQAGTLLYNLLQKWIFFVDEKRQLHIMTDSFRNFVLNQSESKEIVELMARSRKEGSWQSFKIPLLLGLGGLGLFLFFTQDDLYQKITGLMASLITLRPLLSPFLGKGKEQNDKESRGA